jgi:hypothetical protein
MSYQPYDRNPSGIVFFGTSASDQLYESNPNFTWDGSNGALKIPNGGYIGSQSDFDAIQITTNGDVIFSQDINVAGNLTVNGTTTYLNTETVTLEDPILVLGSISGNPSTSDDNKDRGVQFNWHNGSSAKTGFFGFDDSVGKFTFVPDATIAGEVVSGAAGVIVADLEGNADTATGLSGVVTVQLSNQLSGNSTFQNAGDTCNISASLTADAITDQIEIGTVDGDNDHILIYDSGVGLRKVTPQNFINDLNIVTSFNVSDGTTSVPVDQGETITFADGAGAEFVVTNVGGQPTVTVNSVDSEIVHDNLNGFVANEHINHTNVVLTAGSGLVGGGDISASRRFDVVGGDGITVTENEVEVTVDNTTIELSATNGTGAVRVKDGGITEAKLDRTIETVSSSKTADKDITIVNATSGSVTISLPENGGTGWSGDTTRARIMVVKRIDNNNQYDVIVSKTGSDTIDGATSVQLYHRYETMTFVSDGSNWYII